MPPPRSRIIRRTPKIEGPSPTIHPRRGVEYKPRYAAYPSHDRTQQIGNASRLNPRRGLSKAHRPSIIPPTGKQMPAFGRFGYGRQTRGVQYGSLFYLDGHSLNMDLKPFANVIKGAFPTTIGIPVVLGAASLFVSFVRMEQKEPQWVTIRSRRKGEARGVKQYVELGHKRPKMIGPRGRRRTSGYSWYSGTLRRAIHARLISVGKLVAWGACSVDPKKGQVKKWAWWTVRGSGGRREKTNAYEYARYNEFGTNQRKKRPIFKPAFEKHWRTVQSWMRKETRKRANIAIAEYSWRATQRKRIGRVAPGLKVYR